MPSATRHLLATPKRSEGGSRRSKRRRINTQPPVTPKRAKADQLSTSSAMRMGFRESTGQTKICAAKTKIGIFFPVRGKWPPGWSRTRKQMLNV